MDAAGKSIDHASTGVLGPLYLVIGRQGIGPIKVPSTIKELRAGGFVPIALLIRLGTWSPEGCSIGGGAVRSAHRQKQGLLPGLADFAALAALAALH